MFLLKRQPNEGKPRKGKGQSLIELAIVLSILLTLLATMVEFGVLLNQYISVQDAARTAAREASVADPIADTALFFSVDYGVPNVVINTLKPLVLNTTCPNKAAPGGTGNPCDDIVVSVFSVVKGQTPLRLYKYSTYNNRDTKFTPAQVGARLDASAPNTGLVLVEVYYSYPQMLKLPFVTTIVPDPIPIYVFAIMPLSAAEPTPTPKP